MQNHTFLSLEKPSREITQFKNKRPSVGDLNPIPKKPVSVSAPAAGRTPFPHKPGLGWADQRKLLFMPPKESWRGLQHSPCPRTPFSQLLRVWSLLAPLA